MKAAVACLGSRFRGDDAVGPLVAERLHAAGITVLDCHDEPTRLIDRWAGLDLLVVVDAVCGGGEVGTLHRIEAVDGQIPGDLRFASTHAFGIAEALALGRVVDRAPRRVVVLGVEGGRFAIGDPVSAAVVDALDALVEAVAHELEVTPCTRKR